MDKFSRLSDKQHMKNSRIQQRRVAAEKAATADVSSRTYFKSNLMPGGTSSVVVPAPDVSAAPVFNYGNDHVGVGDGVNFSEGSGGRTRGSDDDETWNELIPKLVEAYLVSCASKKPDIKMDDAPIVVCGCTVPTTKIKCYYFTRIVERQLSLCSCHGDSQPEMLLKKYHLFAATARYPETAFHVELLGLFGDARNTLSASFDGFSKLLATRLYGGQALPASFKDSHSRYLMMMNGVDKVLAGDVDCVRS
ncbi:unnamed protein product [Absidia cylindrospora]